MSRKPILTTLVVYIMSLVLVGCGGSDPSHGSTPQPFYTRVGEVTLKPGDSIPVSVDKPLLTVKGKIGTFNAGETVEMDLNTLESVGQVEYRVTDPFLEKSILYRGILMSELLNVLQVSPDASELEMRALNDYTVSIPINEFITYPVLFALQQDGVYMPISYRGPAMLVFPYDNFEFEHRIYENYWIWQIAEITVK